MAFLKDLKVLGYEWHTSHQYELAKCGFSYVLWNWGGNRWKVNSRPVPKNVRIVKEFDEKEFDLAILHFDQHLVDGLPLLKNYRRVPFVRFKKLNIPKIAIFHGAPNDFRNRDLLNEMVGNIPVVCNDYEAERMLGNKNSRTIICGLSPEEWQQTSYKNGVCCSLHLDFGGDNYYNGKFLFDAVKKNIDIDMLRMQPTISFEEYRELLSSYSVYHNPTFASANPRARAEAMMCGLAIVTTAHMGEKQMFPVPHDYICLEDNFWRQSKHLLWLLENPDECRKIGKRGRKIAQKVFDIKRYVKEWGELIEETIKKA